jgi:hypothetical protein
MVFFKGILVFLIVFKKRKDHEAPINKSFFFIIGVN